MEDIFISPDGELITCYDDMYELIVIGVYEISPGNIRFIKKQPQLI